MKGLLGLLQDAVMPPRCAFCGSPTIADEGPVCTGCCSDLPYIPLSPAQPPFASEIVPLAYEFPVDAAIKALKFRRRLFFGPALASLLCNAADALPTDVDALLPVPLHWRRQCFRGFNQALEIGKPVARHLGVPVIHNVVRRRATPSQSGLSAAERARNLRAAFVARGRPRYQHVVVIDDVVTTGATMREVARTLIESGIKKVSALAVARA